MAVSVQECAHCEQTRNQIRKLSADKVHLQNQLEVRAQENEQHKKDREDYYRGLKNEVEDLRNMVNHYQWMFEQEDIPSVFEQTPWKSGMIRFPDEGDRVQYFNPSVIRGEDNRLILAARRTTVIGDSGINHIILWDLSDDMAVSNPRRLNFEGAQPEEHHEDPRLFAHDGKVWITCCNFILGSYAHQVFGQVSDNLNVRRIHLEFGGNGRSIAENAGHEKNWTFFTHERGLFLIYTMNPHLLVRVNNADPMEKYTTSQRNLLWRYGPVRGGTCPVRVGDEYFAFFHSSIPWMLRRRRYFMGFYAFEKDPPFQITRMSGAPLLSGSSKDPMKTDSPLVVFPCGADYFNGQWTVTMGINDKNTAWMKIPHQTLLDMTPPVYYST